MKELNNKKIIDLLGGVVGLAGSVRLGDTPLLKRVARVADAVITHNVVNVEQFKRLEAVREVVHFVELKQNTTLGFYRGIDTSHHRTPQAFFEILERLTINNFTNYVNEAPALKLTLAREKVNELKNMILEG